MSSVLQPRLHLAISCCRNTSVSGAGVSLKPSWICAATIGLIWIQLLAHRFTLVIRFLVHLTEQILASRFTGYAHVTTRSMYGMLMSSVVSVHSIPTIILMNPGSPNLDTDCKK